MSLATTAPSQEPLPTPPNEVNGPPPLKLIMIHQDPLSLTLDTFTLLSISALLLFGLHFIDRPVLSILILLTPLSLLIHNDYLNFLKLGPGGTPSTPSGYIRLTFYRLFTLRDPFSLPPTHSQSQSQTQCSSEIKPVHPPHGILANLPYRPGPRPTVAGLAPQRQLNQHCPLPIYHRLHAALSLLASQSPTKFTTATSSLEKHGFALFARHPATKPYHNANGEVCHVHASTDRSLHLNLHPEDIREVLEKGWGERHPLALDSKGEGSRWETGLGLGVRLGLVRSLAPWTFCMVYAPRGE